MFAPYDGIIVGLTAAVVAAILCCVFLRRAAYSFADPFVFVNVSVPFSAALLAVLCSSGLIESEKLTMFFIVLTAFLAGSRAILAFFSRDVFRQVIIRTVSRLSLLEVKTILLTTTCITMILAAIALNLGGQGDARQEFTRAFRPLVTIQSGLFYFSLLALLSPKISKINRFMWFVVLVVPSITYSGKSIFLPILYWYGLKFFITQKKPNFVVSSALIACVFVGVAGMGVIAYGASSIADVFLLITSRLWLSGDIYIYAYQHDGLLLLKNQYTVSFLSYILHPITSLVGIRGYDKPLGAMLMSEFTGTSVLTGPNPQLPVLLDYFFPNEWIVSASIAFLVGFLVMSIRVVGTRLAQGRSRFLALGAISGAIFCPAAGFLDTSLVLITLVEIASVTVCGVVAELISGRPSRQNVDITNANLRGWSS